ncbi:MAG TPA: hypothetical protein VLB03_07365 [Nocardioidaceae bacterium]|nr:hypothetical protein [Nocardioidaceae bacterium]
MEWWRVKAVVNAVNGSTALGLAVAATGRARFSRGPRGLVLATGFAFRFPPAGAFTIGNVVVTRHDLSWWGPRQRVLVHEERHSWQYAVTLGLPMVPLYAVAACWSYLRGGDWSTYNVFETRAGLADGGYPSISRRRRRLVRTA